MPSPKTKKPRNGKTSSKKKATSTKKKAKNTSVPFTFFAPDATSVHVAGSFNDWNPKKHKLTKKKDGTWSKKVALKPGRHEYKFVINGDTWECDQHPRVCCPDGCGGMNAVLDL